MPPDLDESVSKHSPPPNSTPPPNKVEQSTDNSASFREGAGGDHDGEKINSPPFPALTSDTPPPATASAFPSSDTRVWPQRNPIAFPKGIDALGTVASPLLAGFSLTTVVQLLNSSPGPWLKEWCLALFSVASVLFLWSLHFGAEYMKYTATPSERLDYSPEARFQSDILDRVRARHFEEMELRSRYQDRFERSYNFAIILFMCGLWALLFPHYFHSLHNFYSIQRWPWGNVTGLFIVGIAILIETVWVISKGARPKNALPLPIDEPPVDRLAPPAQDMAEMLSPKTSSP